MARKRRKLSPYLRIVRNARRGLGVHLSVDEVYGLSIDDAISQRALMEEEEEAADAD